MPAAPASRRCSRLADARHVGRGADPMPGRSRLRPPGRALRGAGASSSRGRGRGTARPIGRASASPPRAPTSIEARPQAPACAQPSPRLGRRPAAPLSYLEDMARASAPARPTMPTATLALPARVTPGRGLHLVPSSTRIHRDGAAPRSMSDARRRDVPRRDSSRRSAGFARRFVREVRRASAVESRPIRGRAGAREIAGASPPADDERHDEQRQQRDRLCRGVVAHSAGDESRSATPTSTSSSSSRGGALPVLYITYVGIRHTVSVVVGTHHQRLRPHADADASRVRAAGLRSARTIRTPTS